MQPTAAVTATGHRAVVCNTSMYFTVPMAGSPSNWGDVWLDIGLGVPAEQKKSLLLGGEMTAWTDTYCNPRECGAMHEYHPEKGAELFNRTRDAEYARSYGGMIWPRGFVGAAAFWNYNASVDPQSAEFVQEIWSTNDALARRGSLVCPSNCSCDEMTACGKPYITNSSAEARLAGNAGDDSDAGGAGAGTERIE